MKHHQHTLSEDMYHRVYRLMNRGTDPRLIAAALDLPLRTILNVIARLRKSQSAESEIQRKPEEEKSIKGSSSFLDVYFLTKTRYTVLQLVGYCIREQAPVRWQMSSSANPPRLPRPRLGMWYSRLQ